jgi:hypothetical protein
MEIRVVLLGTVEGFDEALTYKVRPAEIRPAKFYAKTRGLRKMKRLSPLMPEKLSSYKSIQLLSLLCCARGAVQDREQQSVRCET